MGGVLLQEESQVVFVFNLDVDAGEELGGKEGRGGRDLREVAFREGDR